MASPQLKPSSPSSRDLVPAASAVLARAFDSDPAITYMLSSMSAAERTSYLPKYFTALLTAATMNKATIDEAGNWKCCGVLMPPGEKVDNPRTLVPAGLVGMVWAAGWRACVHMLYEWPSLSEPAKKKGLRGQERCYYVFFVGTNADARGQGLCSSLMRVYQARAAKKGMPIWLEATTEKSMKIYAKLGWEVVEDWVLGKGRANPSGRLEKGGEGVRIWGMVWWPPAERAEG